MKKYLLKRFLISIFSLWAIFTFVSLLIRIIPGDPVIMMLGEGAPPANVKKLRRELGLDKPFYIQYLNDLNGLLHGNLKKSWITGKDNLRTILNRYPATITLAFFSMIFAIIISFPLGILGGLKKDTLWEKGATFISVMGISIPHFALGPLLILFFSILIPIFPVSGMGGFSHIVLPAITLGSGLSAYLTKMIKKSIQNELEKPYVLCAYAKGLSKFEVIKNHVLKNSMIPVITLMGLQFGVLLSGAIITETIFSWPGIGRLLIRAIESRDYPLAQATILAISFTYIFVTALVDVIYTILDPRIKFYE